MNAESTPSIDRLVENLGADIVSSENNNYKDSVSDELRGLDFDFEDEEDFSTQRSTRLTIEKLKRSWLNEHLSPDILKYDQEMVLQTKALLQRQQNLVDSRSDVEHFRLANNLIQLEMDRIQFMLSAYLRARLFKIERFVMHILLTQEYADRLSEQELSFASSFVDSLAEHLHRTFLDFIPESLRSLDENSEEEQMIECPDLEEHVFFKPLEDIGAVLYQRYVN